MRLSDILSPAPARASVISQVTRQQNRLQSASQHRFIKLCTAVLLVCVLVLTSCAGAESPASQTEVLGVSIVTTAFGTTQISSVGGGVNVQVLEAEREGNSAIGLALDGEIIALADVVDDEEVQLKVDTPGTYEVWAITTTDAVTDGDVRLAPSQRIDRLGRVTLGS